MQGSKLKEPTIRDLFKSMSLSPAVHSNNSALAKQKEYTNISGFINGKFINREDIKCDSGNEWDVLSSLAAESSSKGFKTWSSLDAFSRSKILLRISQEIEKNQQILISLEVFDSNKHVHRVKTKDIPNLIESFDYNAGCALQLNDESMAKSLHPIGPVCVIAEEFNNPLITLSLHVSSLLAAGNSVLLLSTLGRSAFELFLAEICTKSGLPDGVLNVIPVDHDKLNDFGKLSAFSKVICTGSYEKGLCSTKLSSKAVLPLDVLIPKRPLVIVYENADLHSAANGVLEAFFFHDTRSQSGGCKVFIQESVSKKFLEILKRHFKNILMGSNQTNTDLSCLVTKEQKEILTGYIKDAKNIAECFCDDSLQEGCSQDTFCPLLINGLQTGCKLVHEELGGPIIVTVPFRTVKESISMYNCDNIGSPVSIWSEKISVAVEVAHKLRSGVVWINSENIIDPRSAFCGIYHSGNSTEGGKEAFFSHLTVLPEALLRCKSNAFDQEEKYEAWLKEKIQVPTSQIVSKEMHEYKLYINGIQKQSENGTVPLDNSTLVPAGTESDVQSAISSAVAAQAKWETIAYSQKRKILRSVASKLKEYKEGYISELQRISGSSSEACEKEFNDTLDLLHYWSSQNEKLNGSMQEIKNNCIVLQNRNPLGVIGIQCPDEMPLLSFLSLFIPAIAFGNTVVALAGPKYPTLALKLSEVFTLGNIPGGVINVISGDLSRLVPVLCQHNDVNAVWYTDIPMKAVYSSFKCNFLQRKFCCQDIWKDFNRAKSLKLLMESTYSKTIYLPAGEIFAN